MTRLLASTYPAAQIAGIDLRADYVAEIKALREQNVGPSEIARRLGIHRASVHRVLGA
jgi:hypothetical protein